MVVAGLLPVEGNLKIEVMFICIAILFGVLGAVELVAFSLLEVSWVYQAHTLIY